MVVEWERVSEIKSVYSYQYMSERECVSVCVFMVIGHASAMNK